MLLTVELITNKAYTLTKSFRSLLASRAMSVTAILTIRNVNIRYWNGLFSAVGAETKATVDVGIVLDANNLFALRASESFGLIGRVIVFDSW